MMRTPHSTRAFSLIEVAMAIGLLAFCMIAILGLLPTALNTSRQSIDKNAETRMLQTVRANLLQYPTSTLPQESRFYFDADGSMLPADAAGNSPAEAFYAVTAATEPTTNLPESQNTAKLRTARISILHIPRNAAVNRCLHLPDNGF